MKDRSTLESEVAELVSEILGSSVNAEGSMETVPAWDSLRHVEIIFAFEETYGVRLTEAEMASLVSVKTLAERARQG